ncbi:MAG: response regulator [Syntrophaceae bacterium]|nr:response regulator [Syntrophaceae bacterium]
MKESILNGKRILVVNDDPDILEILEEEIIIAAPNSYIDKANHYQKGIELLASFTYDLVILDMTLSRISRLLNLSLYRPSPFPVVMLTAYNLDPETLRPYTEMGVRAYLPKEKLGQIVPFLEDSLKHQYLPFWRYIFENLRGFSNTHRRRKRVEVPC